MRTAADIEIILRDDLTDHPITTVRLLTPVGEMIVIAEVSVVGRELFLAGVHIQSENLGPNTLGTARLRQLAAAVMERMGLDAITIGGAVRTTGAGRGRLPRPLRFARSLSA
ncbi:MAG TPA: hypothetical protein VHW66_13595 [Stellaceae bacterium]|nr:hypothetical protein [Stellaceae bacterium]